MATWGWVCRKCQESRHKECADPRMCDCAKNGHKK